MLEYNDKLRDANELLRAANLELVRSFQNFDVSKDLSCSDLCKQRAIEMAKTVSAQAGCLILEAMKVIEDLPRVDAKRIEINIIAWGNVEFYQLMQDTRARRRIKECLQKMVEIEQDCLPALKWIQAAIDKEYQPVFDEVSERHSIDKETLDSYRRELIQQALRNSNEKKPMVDEMLDNNATREKETTSSSPLVEKAALERNNTGPPSYDSLYVT